MHYANGREAKNGDKVVLIPALKNYSGNPRVGILYDAKPGNDFCNGYLAQPSPSDPVADLSTCLHYDDVVQAVKNDMAPPESEKDSAPRSWWDSKRCFEERGVEGTHEQ